MVALRVRAVIRGIDMRAKHELRTHWMERTPIGHVTVLLNGDTKMARLIDHEGGVHDYYAPRGVRFDEAALYNMVERGMRLAIREGRDTIHRTRKADAAA